jgi:hypothetical protein
MAALTEPVQQVDLVLIEGRVADADLLKSQLLSPAFDVCSQGLVVDAAIGGLSVIFHGGFDGWIVTPALQYVALAVGADRQGRNNHYCSVHP